MNGKPYSDSPTLTELNPMASHQKRLSFLLLALFAAAMTAAAWAFVDWHRTRYAKFAAALSQLPSNFSHPVDAAGPTSTNELTLKPLALTDREKTTVLTPIPPGPTYSSDPGVDAIENALYPVLSEAIASDFPDLKLSPNELMDLSKTIVQLRNALADLRIAGRTAENFGTLRQLEELRDNAVWDFERITGMSLQEFLRRAPTDGGLDNERIFDDEIILEPLADYMP
jgi:hypothetical protein